MLCFRSLRSPVDGDRSSKNRCTMGNRPFWNSDRHEAELNYWMGPAKTSWNHHFPSCTDELLDWTSEASRMFDLFLRKGVSRRRELVKTAPLLEDLREVTFLPCILPSAKEDAKKLSSMKLLDRICFLDENMIVLVSAPGKLPAILSVQTFVNEIFFVLKRYLELLLILANASQQPENGTLTTSCPICVQEDPKLVVLPCSHCLCTRCKKKWVSTKLSCPFCRRTFQKKSVQEWEVIEWQPKDAVEDIVRLEAMLEKAMRQFDFSKAATALHSAYEPAERMFQTHEDEGVLFVERFID